MYSVIYTENDGKVVLEKTIFRNINIDDCWDFIAGYLNSDNQYNREVGFSLDVVDKLGDIVNSPVWIVKLRKNAMYRVMTRQVN